MELVVRNIDSAYEINYTHLFFVCFLMSNQISFCSEGLH